LYVLSEKEIPYTPADDPPMPAGGVQAIANADRVAIDASYEPSEVDFGEHVPGLSRRPRLARFRSIAGA
jgi:hypothetical protein